MHALLCWLAATTACALGAMPACAAQMIERGQPRMEGYVMRASGDEGRLAGAHLGMEFVAAERLGVTVTPQIGLARGRNVEDDLSLISSADLQVRWYFLRLSRFGLFVDAGAGIQYSATRSLPASGAHFNFRLRAGVAGRVRLTPRWDLLAGYNWLHMSTANVLIPNVGHDGPMHFVGASYALRR
jgi:hypothetical protein